MKIKAVAIDLDGTLLTEDKRITDINKMVLKDLARHGIKIYLATGRPYFSAKKYADDLGVGDIMITYNGARVVNYKTDEVLYHMPLGASLTQKIIDLARKRNIHINLYQDNTWYVEDGTTPECLHYEKYIGLTPSIKNFDDFDDYEMTKITIQNMDRSDEFNNLCDEIENVFGKEVYTAKSQDYLFEVLNKNVNKGIVLKEILKLHGIDPSECIAFGDALNDLEMLTEVGMGVAMGNAPTHLKHKVRYVTDTNENNGVAKFLKKYFY